MATGLSLSPSLSRDAETVRSRSRLKTEEGLARPRPRAANGGAGASPSEVDLRQLPQTWGRRPGVLELLGLVLVLGRVHPKRNP